MKMKTETQVLFEDEKSQLVRIVTTGWLYRKVEIKTIPKRK